MTDKSSLRDRIRAHAEAARQDGWPRDWFDAIYTDAEQDPSQIPWADLETNPNVATWAEREGLDGTGQRALKVGCGLGDDAEALVHHGFSEIVAFDIAPTAIDWCTRRFPDSPVHYMVADVLSPPQDWRGTFDFILEAYTLQVLPAEIRPQAIAQLAALLAPGGRLLVVARGRDEADPTGQMPWPLTRVELRASLPDGVSETSFEDYMDGEAPPVRRFRAVYTRRRMTP